MLKGSGFLSSVFSIVLTTLAVGGCVELTLGPSMRIKDAGHANGSDDPNDARSASSFDQKNYSLTEVFSRTPYEIHSYVRYAGPGHRLVYVTPIGNDSELASLRGSKQIYAVDLNATDPKAQLVSSLDGSPGNAADMGADEADISDDGRYVVFSSRASNFPGGDGSKSQIYLKDLAHLEAAPVLISTLNGISPSPNGAWLPTISGDGRYIYFSAGIETSLDADWGLVENENAPRYSIQLVRKDRTQLSLKPELVSSDSGQSVDLYPGGLSNFLCGDSMSSSDGRYVVFRCGDWGYASPTLKGRDYLAIYLKDMSKPNTPAQRIPLNGTKDAILVSFDPGAKWLAYATGVADPSLSTTASTVVKIVNFEKNSPSRSISLGQSVGFNSIQISPDAQSLFFSGLDKPESSSKSVVRIDLDQAQAPRIVLSPSFDAEPGTPECEGPLLSPQTSSILMRCSVVSSLRYYLGHWN
jgi:hypothetical protein